MIRQLQALVLVTLTATANAATVRLQPRDNGTLASLPQYDSNPAARAAAVAAKKAGYLYGPSLIGNASFYPSGTLGNARVMADRKYKLDLDFLISPRAQLLDTLAVQNSGS
jgi:hypothetical protein